MNLENINADVVVKNYKEMCSILGEQILEGNSKVAQLKEWSRYFDYEKKGHKFIIKEIYAVELPKDFSDNDVYTRYVQTILTKYLKEKGYGEFTLTQLLKLCGFVNSKWNDLTLLDEYTEKKDITYAQAKYYYNQLCYHVYTYCNTALIRCLERLYKRGFLQWNRILHIQEGDINRIASQEEVSQYLDVVMNVRKELDIKYVNLYNRDGYYTAIDSALKKEFGWDKTYELIRIIFAKNHVDDMIKESEEEYKDALLEINDHCLQQMYKYVDVDIKRDIQKLTNKMEDVELAELYEDFFVKDDTTKEYRLNITDMYIDVKSEIKFS